MSDEIKQMRGDLELARLQLEAAQTKIDDLLAAGDRLESQLARAAMERDRLRDALRCFANKDATLLAQNGDVIVKMAVALTDAEREAVETCILGLVHPEDSTEAATLRNLLERTKNAK